MNCVLKKKSSGVRLSYELLKRFAIDIFEWLNIINDDALIDFVASRIERPKFHNLFADLGDKATIASTPSSGEFGIHSCLGFNGFA